MGLFIEIVREDENKSFCRKIADKIDKYRKNPQIVEVLKELGREVLDSLPTESEWSRKYGCLFRD